MIQEAEALHLQILENSENQKNAISKKGNGNKENKDLSETESSSSIATTYATETQTDESTDDDAAKPVTDKNKNSIHKAQ